MVKGKKKFALWLTPGGFKKMEEQYRKDGCKSRSEFIERAIDFYCGFLNTDRCGDYLPQAVSSTIDGALLTFGDRLGRILFKQAVELGMMGRLVAADSQLDNGTIDELRSRCVLDVKKTKGQLSFRDMLRTRTVE